MAQPAAAPTDGSRIAAAEAWIAQDPDLETRAELSELVSRVKAHEPEAAAELADRFDTRLAFGTAGLRGEIAAGPNRMNRVLVAQAAAGLAAYLSERAYNQGGATPSVVIGYDGRKNSAVFAKDTAEIISGAGLRAILLPRMLPTPVVAFAVRHLATSAGVMVTASHNPPNDNGYKVYLGDNDGGSQIVSPADAEIAQHILNIADSVQVPDIPRGKYETAPEAVVDEYVARTAAVASDLGHPITAGGGASVEPVTVYTAMHGVGWETVAKVLTAAKLSQPNVVAEQIAPDARFPTVSFPNPEEPGAMDLSFAKAREVDAELVIANDPDADRLAIAIPAPEAAGGYRQLTGNEVGLLLGWQAAQHAYDAGNLDGMLACSVVSSPGLEAIAREYGLEFRATLTGFKWISRAPGLIFGFEEALGYLVNPQVVHDKDGISAALAFMTLAAKLKAAGKTIADQLDAFDEKFGSYMSSQISIRVTDISKIAQVMAQLRATPPTEIGGIQVDHIDDLADGYQELPPSDVLRIVLADGGRIMVRPSGTEPKLKIYLDTWCDTGTLAERRAAVSNALTKLEDGMRKLVS